MRCHYEVLGVSRDATVAEIKTAYRALALKWHPDRNIDRATECTEIFQEIQQAYEVLSDRHDRAWYDKHREEILNGGANYVDDSLNLMHYFQTRAYRGFGDDEKGFYSVYSFVFKTIVEEDSKFVDDKCLLEDIPQFGTSSSPFEEVKPFYDYWQSYCTFKTFVWLRKYDIREAPNRRVLRLMEKENKKLRDAAKKERNEEIRELVQYVRKRDERLKAYKEKREEEERNKAQLMEQRRAAERKERLEKLKEYKEQDWNSMSQLERNLNEVASHVDEEFGEDNVSDQSDNENFEQFHCIACDKLFKSDKALKNHEKSRKHREKVELIREVMEEDMACEIETLDSTSDSNVNESRCQIEVTDEGTKVNVHVEEECIIDVAALNLRDSLDLPAYISRSRSNSRRSFKSAADSDEGDHDPGGALHLADSVTLAFAQKLKKKKKRSKDHNVTKSSEDELDDSILDEGERKMAELIMRDDVGEYEGLQEGYGEELIVVGISDDNPGKKDVISIEINSEEAHIEPKRKNKSRRKSKKGQVDDLGEEELSVSLCCNVCDQEFPTRNQLFKHINTSGHALKVEKNSVANGDSRKQKGKRKH